jgi:hypothetical protein
MLNSAYGKFGTNANEFRDYRLTPQGEYPLLIHELEEMELLGMTEPEYLAAFGFELHNHNEFGFSLWSKPDPSEKFYNVAVAASITGFVRAYLWRAINEAVNPVYCDTDSIICKGFNGEVGAELGQWDIEGVTNSGIYIGGKKLYTMTLDNGKHKTSSKGCRLKHDQVKELVRDGKDIIWQNEAPTFSLKRGVHFIERKIRMT